MHRLTMAAMLAASLGMAGACAAQSETEEELSVKVAPNTGHHAFAFSIDGARISGLDEDGDGRVSREEFMARRAERFDEMDENDDGFLEDEEFESYVERKVERAMERVQVRTGRHMEELEEHLDELGDRLARNFEHMGDFRFHGGPWLDGFRFRFDGPDGDDMIERLDKDGDGTLSREEFEARKKDPFDFLDENEDGQLSEDELEHVPGHFMRRPFIYRFGEIEDDEDT